MVEVVPQNTSKQQDIMVLPTKFAPPLMRPTVVARPQLIERLDKAVQQHQLTLVSAPAGSGKSTLLSSWYVSSNKNMPIVWIALERGDNDPARFWTAFILGLQKYFPELGRNALVSLRTPQTCSLDNIVHILLHDMLTLSKSFVLVLDDYQAIEMQEIHQSFAFLLEHLPSHVHVVLSTRTDPPLPLARLRVRGQLAEIRASEINFTAQEAEAFFSQVMALHLTSCDISTLVARTKGWIAGLQLAALSLQGCNDTGQFIASFGGSHSSLVDYLAEEILQQQSEQVQHFLLFTSLLERFTTNLCDTILEQTGSYRLLKQIEQANLFVIVLDEQQQWYRYHHLFAEFLRVQLHRQYPEQVKSIHGRAAFWYEQHGYMTEAITHLLASSDAELAADCIERYCDTLIKHGELTTLMNWVASLSEDVVHTRPRLCLYYAAALGSTNKLEAAELRVQEAEHILYKQVQQNAITQEHLQSVMGELVTVRTSLAGFRGDVPHTIQLSQQALAQMPEENGFMRGILTASLATAYAVKGDVVASYQAFVTAEALGRSANHIHLWLASLGSQAYMKMEQGCFYQAAEICQRVLQIEQGQEQTTSSLAYTVMGELYYQWNMLDEAEDALRRGYELGQEWGYLTVLARCTLFLALVKKARGDEKGARALLQQLEQQALQHNLSQIVIWATALRAYFSLTQGDIKIALQWTKGAGLSVQDSPSYLDEFVYLILARILFAVGKQHEVMSLLTRMLHRAEADERGRNILNILVTQAILFNEVGDTTQAQTILARALSLAEPAGNLRVFIEEGTPMLHHLTSLMQKSKNDSSSPAFSQAFVQSLLTAMGYRAEEHHVSHPLGQHTTWLLTGREQEILHLVASGLSNQQIADTLVIAVNTVKWYLKQLSRKLNAHSRTQIIAYAHEKHFL